MIDNLEYNTERTKLIIPEYGRHIHKMIDHALSSNDIKDRNKVAKAIIGVMGNLNPHLRDVPDFQHKLWDQLFIMSDFNLDVDSPFPKPVKEVYSQRPEKLNYPQLLAPLHSRLRVKILSIVRLAPLGPKRTHSLPEN